MRATFDRFTLDPDQRTLFDGTEPIHLGPQAFLLLEILVANTPRALSKQELYEQIWPDTFVDEANLAGLINEVRAALGGVAGELGGAGLPVPIAAIDHVVSGSDIAF